MTQETNALTLMQNKVGFIADATSSLEKMEAYATLLIKSGLVPKHFYVLDQYRKPVKNAQGEFEGNTAAVIMTIQHGFEVGMSISQALQQIVPVNGLMSIKGDGAKALIMNSGVCEKWAEEEVGEKGKDTYGFKITAVRKGGQSLSSTFTVSDAKRAGLWITDEMAAKNDKLLGSAWYKFGPRMLRYRALGFIARDLFPDILQGMYTEEEARDMDENHTTFKTEDGITIKMSDDKGKKLSTAAGNALKETKSVSTLVMPKAEDVPSMSAPSHTISSDNTSGRTDPTMEAESFKPEEPKVQEEKVSDTNLTLETIPHYTIDELKLISTKDTLALCDKLLGIDTTEVLFVGENKAKRVVGWLRKLILAHQDGTITELIKKEFGVDYTNKIIYVNKKEEAPTPVAEKEPVIQVVDISEYKVGELTIQEPTEGTGRDFGDMMAISSMATSKNITKADIMQHIEEKCLNYTKLDDFYRFAPENEIYDALMIK